LLFLAFFGFSPEKVTSGRSVMYCRKSAERLRGKLRFLTEGNEGSEDPFQNCFDFGNQMFRRRTKGNVDLQKETKNKELYPTQTYFKLRFSSGLL